MDYSWQYAEQVDVDTYPNAKKTKGWFSSLRETLVQSMIAPYPSMSCDTIQQQSHRVYLRLEGVSEVRRGFRDDYIVHKGRLAYTSECNVSDNFEVLVVNAARAW